MKAKLQEAHDTIDRFYRCPICDAITQGWFIDISKGLFGLECSHTFGLWYSKIPEVRSVKHLCRGIEAYLSFDDTYIQRSHSFLGPFFGGLAANLNQAIATYITYNDTAGVSRIIGQPNSGNYSLPGLAGDAALGIIVGTGSGANTTTINVIGTLIAHGNGAGQLSYGGIAVGAISVGATTTLAITRPYTNNSGGNITINEAAVYVNTFDNGSTRRNFMVLRDVLGTPKTINSGGASSTATYSLQHTIA